jgi:DNA-directed RNA polymerase subunit N (RpoN/RPB10)
MIIPVRCFTCNKTISHLWNEYESLIKSGNEPKKVLDLLKIERYCCRRMFLSNVDILDKLMMYSEYNQNLGKTEK